MAYRNPTPANEMISEIRRNLEERGCTDIVLHTSGEYVHVSAVDPKRKRSINVHGRPYQPKG